MFELLSGRKISLAAPILARAAIFKTDQLTAVDDFNLCLHTAAVSCDVD
jgi:hypothetical protein